MNSHKESASNDQRLGALETFVALARSQRPDYGPLTSSEPAPELPHGCATTVAMAALRDLFKIWGLDAVHFGTSSWNPLREFISAGAKVLLKPNWVLHWNRSGLSIDCLLTHSSVIEAVLEYVALAKPGAVILGDSPVQGCDLQALRLACGIDEMVDRFRRRSLDLSVADFRRTVLPGEVFGSTRIEDRRSMEHYVLFDLKGESLLEPLAADAHKFRVTMYNPDLLYRTHAAGRHQYLIAREVMDADVVINLPKLKAHKKACVTGALKNLVGINGHKEYLPHHRKGGGATGGDCYPGGSWFKGRAEDLLDAANRARPGRSQITLARAAAILARLAKLFGADGNMEGSWYGNDTVWRMALDLQRILLYGRTDGSLAATAQRRLVSITDAIIGGEGEGPMAPTPVPSGFLTGALNPAAVEWVNCRLMGFDPQRIPIVREAFGNFPFPISLISPREIRVLRAEGEQSSDRVFPLEGRSFRPPQGWWGHCELEQDDAWKTSEPTLVA